MKKYLVELTKTSEERWVIEADNEKDVLNKYRESDEYKYEFVEARRPKIVIEVIREVKNETGEMKKKKKKFIKGINYCVHCKEPIISETILIDITCPTYMRGGKKEVMYIFHCLNEDCKFAGVLTMGRIEE